MAYSIDRIIPFNLVLTSPGLTYANFVTARAIGTQDMLAGGVTFEVDTYKTYSTTAGVAEDFDVTSDVYQMATIWFAQTPSPGTQSFQVWMWDDVNDSIIETLNKSVDSAAWMFNVAVPVDVYTADATISNDLASWADTNGHNVGLTFSDADSLDENIDTDIPSALAALGARLVTQKYRGATTIANDAKQAYAWLAEMAYFKRFDWDATNSSVDPEFKVMSLVVSDDLKPSQYTALEDRKLGFYTDLELKGETVTSRCKNSWSTSSYNETVDDVITLEIFKNRCQVDGFNYLSKRKRGLRRPRDYSGMIDTIESVAHQGAINGSFAQDVEIEHPETGETVTLKNGYLMLSKGDDVSSLTAAQISAREYPPVRLLVVLARSARVCEITAYVE